MGEIAAILSGGAHSATTGRGFMACSATDHSLGGDRCGEGRGAGEVAAIWRGLGTVRDLRSRLYGTFRDLTSRVYRVMGVMNG